MNRLLVFSIYKRTANCNTFLMPEMKSCAR